jgi:hypothetical protein
MMLFNPPGKELYQKEHELTFGVYEMTAGVELEVLQEPCHWLDIGHYYSSETTPPDNEHVLKSFIPNGGWKPSTTYLCKFVMGEGELERPPTQLCWTFTTKPLPVRLLVRLPNGPCRALQLVYDLTPLDSLKAAVM